MARGAGWFSLLLPAALLSACTTVPDFLPLYQEERAKICHVSVEVLPSAFAFDAAAISGPVEGLAAGTAAGLLLLPAYGPFAILIPVLATSCGAARAKHPEGEVALREAFETATKDALDRALGGELARRLAQCRRAQPDQAGRELTDTVIQIKRVQLSWGCPRDRQVYMIVVHWQALVEGSRRMIADIHTSCSFTSSRSVEEWRADLAWARREVELALAKTGEWIALHIVGVEPSAECRHVLLDPAEEKAGP